MLSSSTAFFRFIASLFHRMLYIMVLAAVAAADGDVSCATACARCDSRSSAELATVYCALCRECRDRRREWLVTAAPFRRSKPFGSRNMAPVQPNHYREDAYYRRDARSEPRRHQPDCPPPPPCDDDEEIGYIKVYGLKRTTCPPAPPCITQTRAPRFKTKSTYSSTRRTHTSPRSRLTQPSTSSMRPIISNQCCPMIMPMMPYPCVCPLGVFGPGPGIFGLGAVHYPRLRALKPGGLFGPSLGANGHSQATSDSTVSTTQSTTQTEPVYLYIGIPKEMKSVVDSQT